MGKLLEWFKYFILMLITFFVYYFLQSILLLPFMEKLTTMPYFVKSIVIAEISVYLMDK